jgi:hypothetical protein
MTLDEYAQEVGAALRNAHNAKDMAALHAAFRDADATLASNSISGPTAREFWSNVRKAAFSGRWLVEKQANSALVDLMNAIQQGIAAREAQK